MRAKLKKKVKKLLFKKGDNKDVGEVLKGGVVAFAYRIITMFVSYGLIIFISRKLGTQGMGIYNLCIATSGILIMVGCIGFNTSVVRFVSQYRAQQWHATIELLFKSVMRYSVAISAILAMGLYFLAEFLATDIFADPLLTEPLRITAIFLPFMVVLTINVEFIRALKWVHISELFRNLSVQAIVLIGTVIASFFALTNETPLVFYAIGAFTSMLVTIVIISKYLRSNKGKPQGPDENVSLFSFKTHFIISLPMIMTSFIQLINGKVDILMIGYFKDTSAVAIFGVAFKLSVITNFVIGALKTIAMPKLSELFWSNKMPELDRVMQYSTKVIFYFAFPISLLLFLFPKTILNFVQEDFVSGAATLRIFAVTQLIHAGSGMVAAFLNMSGNQAFFTRIVTATTLLNIILNIIMIPTMGMEGAAIATLIATAIWNVAGVVFIYRKYGIVTFYNPFYKGKVQEL